MGFNKYSAMKHYIKSTVCIVGSGFCGYAAYLKLTNQNIDVILVEGGEFTTPPSISEQPEYISLMRINIMVL